MDFRLYKVLAAHGAGQIEFGTFEKDTTGLKAAYTELKSLYDATAEQRDAFSLDGYLETSSMPPSERPERLPKDSDYRDVLKVFPNRGSRKRSSARWRTRGSTAGCATRIAAYEKISI